MKNIFPMIFGQKLAGPLALAILELFRSFLMVALSGVIFQIVIENVVRTGAITQAVAYDMARGAGYFLGCIALVYVSFSVVDAIFFPDEVKEEPQKP